MKKSIILNLDLFLSLRCLKPENNILFYLKKLNLIKQILSLQIEQGYEVYIPIELN